MNEAIKQMLSRYSLDAAESTHNALVEIMQQIALLGLWRGKFFEHAGFYGGTALRILYGLDRFSEDMDFALRRADPAFTLEPYLQFVVRELKAFDFDVDVKHRVKNVETAVDSAFFKANTQQHFVKVGTRHKTQKDRLIEIKFEVDTDPPYEAETEARFVLDPTSFSVLTFTPKELFAGKMHAVLCRQWRGRVKGRDWYDMLWYIARGTPLNLSHLEAKMRQSKHLSDSEPLTPDRFRDILRARIEGLDVRKAASDVRPFLRDATSLEVWSHDFFRQVCEQITTAS
jgi:predicted nucleotidyltransferase component of viral defense system